MILVNDIEHVVISATTTWKNIYNLHQKSDFVVHVNDIDDEDDKDENENSDEEYIETNDVNLDDEEQE